MIRFLLTLQVVALSAQAAGPPLQDFSSPFADKDCQVIWEAPTNFPTSVKIFAVVPTKFSPETISNLLQLAELTTKNKRRPVQEGVFLGKDVLAYASKEDTRQLSIVPSQGFIAVSKDDAFAAPRQTPVGVPDDKEAPELALNLLRKLGLNTSGLATGSKGEILPSSFSEGSVLHKEKPSGRIVTNVISRSITLTRQIEGITVSGMAGISMKFGNEGKLAYLEWTCRTIKPAGECLVPSAAGFVSRIKSGRTMIFEEQAGKPIQKLTIKRVQLYYWENEGSKPQTMIYPFAVLEAETDLPGKDSQTRLFVPFANE